MLAKAATGSGKNIVPNRLMATSKLSRGEAVALRVCVHERSVMEAIGLGELPRPLYHRRGVVDPNHDSIACRSPGLTCGLPRATTNVEHIVVPPQPVGAAQDLVEEPQLRVV